MSGGGQVDLLSLSAKLELNAAQFQKGVDTVNKRLAKMDARMKQSGKSVDKMKAKLLAMARSAKLGWAIFGAAMAAVAKSTADYTSKLHDLSSRLGISTQAIEKLRYMAESTGVSVGTMEMAMQRMTRRVAEAASGTGEAKDAIKELGLSAEYLNTLSPDKQFELLGKALYGVANEGDRVRLAMKLFDSEGVAMLQTVNQANGDLGTLSERFDELGGATDAATVKVGKEFTQALTDLDRAWEGLKTRLASVFLPLFTWIVEGVTAAVAAINELWDAVVVMFKKVNNALAWEAAKMYARFHNLATMISQLSDGLAKPFFAISEGFLEMSRKLRTEIEEAGKNTGGGGGGGGSGGGTNTGPTAAGVTAENIQQLERQQELLKQQAERLTLSGEELSRFNVAMDASNQMYAILAAAKAKDITLTGEQRQAIADLVYENAELAESIRKQREATEKAQAPINEMAVAIGHTLAQGARDAAGALIDFATGVETNFAKMAKSVVKSIARVILELQILAALKAAFPTLFPAEKGAAVQGGTPQPVHAFASGGIVTGPTLFGMAGGRTGIMGEAGAEAVMPLRRTRNGDLGVAAGGASVNVVINNNAPVDVTAEETPNGQGGMDITVFIERKIESYFDSGGGDRLLGTAFGARRMPR